MNNVIDIETILYAIGAFLSITLVLLFMDFVLSKDLTVS